MSMYNMVHGNNPFAGDWLHILGILDDEKKTDEAWEPLRIRDAWLTDKDGELRIVVHTRAGEGNWGTSEEQDAAFKVAKEHPLFLSTRVCDEVDETYRNFEFSIPEDSKEEIDKLIEEAKKHDKLQVVVDNRNLKDKWDEAIAAMENHMKNREAAQAEMMGKEMFAMSHADDEAVYLFGFGTYEGEEIPPADSVGNAKLMHDQGQPNPKIKLEDGTIVWGCECWWGPKDRFDEQRGDRPIVKADLNEWRQQAAHHQQSQED